MENKDVGIPFDFGNEKLAEKLYEVLIQCYTEAARCQEGEYLAVVIVLENLTVCRIEVRKWNSLETPLPGNELFMTALEGFGPVTGEIEKHARNWADAVMMGLQHAFESVELKIEGSFGHELCWDDGLEESEGSASESRRYKKGGRH